MLMNITEMSSDVQRQVKSNRKRVNGKGFTVTKPKEVSAVDIKEMNQRAKRP